MTDVAAGVTYYYTSDLIGRPTVMRTNHGQALQVSYDEKNRTDAVISQVTNVTTEIGFTYGDGSVGKPEAAITAVSIDGTNQVVYEYDNLGRLSTKTTGTGSGAETVTYTYKQGVAAGTTSTLVESVNDNGVVTEYEYDSLGNITSIIVDNELVKSYEYDALGQLVRENDKEQDVTITYTYNSDGNLVWKRNYEYTEGELGEAIEVLPFSYNRNWRDMLVTYKGRTITYDGIGNPLTYRDGMSFSWIRGRRLGTLTVGDTTAAYTYDDNGIRTSKTVNGTKTTYYLNGSTILTQICGDIRLDFFYDQQGSVIGFKYNDGIYLYQKNIQGDIIGIRNSAGTTIVAYSYDSWGKLLGITGSEANTIGQLNPFRYRGYYYDNESGLYYLNSRYYDAEVGRFVNADIYVSTGQGVLGYNMFAYCLNNPVNYMDRSGHSTEALQWWTTTMWWICGVDTAFPVLDIVYVVGIVVFAVIAIVGTFEATAPVIYVESSSNEQNEEEKAEPETPDVAYPGDDPSVVPGEDYEWKGREPVVGDKGTCMNKKTGEQLHPDLNHPEPVGPHWDYTNG